MASQEEQLEAWCGRLLTALELEGTAVDIGAVLQLASDAAHSVVRPAAPLTTFVAGFAAGLAAGSGQADDDVAMGAAMRAAARECKNYGETGDSNDN
ncbi:DUF6457 domain-containing protein [Arthrobacter sp. zg-Y820]|uniref:DUF6457 domain-containing protein n=1 Tax=unclassified Arthrobacter TaxID=235627 RepID=UPI001E3CFEE7|nr:MULTISPECIES: DUF6457 domain-containing protein [unclassified Arthrobacter]MCC9198419.1 DUF6457 domain-containing protein [Arthrobacter sp. zg-Y820]MDK1281289.1 DUF6457 domain-containing protein [Arthrobacter sp. zg.Y820]MDK1361811.1 DUF6457 domain-containing protein [Arthrobacter sp. zg-Y1219]WIB09923.1 DUF6457 domain-containing protein [Arthrobacter sp. zg-Y820]